MKREIIIKKVMVKLAQSEVDAGVKDWLAGALMAFSSIFGGVDQALGSAKDLDHFLSETSRKVENHRMLKDNIEVKKTFKSLGVEDGKGTFDVTIGPFNVHGYYVGVEGTLKELKLKVVASKSAPQEEIEKWKDTALEFSKDISDAFDNQNKKDQIEHKKQEKNQTIMMLLFQQLEHVC